MSEYDGDIPTAPIALMRICGPFCKLLDFCSKMMTIRRKEKKNSTQPITQLLGFNSSDLHGLGCLLLWAEQEQNQIRDFPLLLLFSLKVIKGKSSDLCFPPLSLCFPSSVDIYQVLLNVRITKVSLHLTLISIL